MSWDNALERRHEPSSEPRATVPRATGDVVERARAYIARMPEAISGQGGHVATFNVARKLADFGLSETDILSVLKHDFNPRCQPPWSDRELEHKASEAFHKRDPKPMEDRPRNNTINNGGPAKAANAVPPDDDFGPTDYDMPNEDKGEEPDIDPHVLTLRRTAAEHIARGEYPNAIATLQTLDRIEAPPGFTKITTSEIFAPLPPVPWLIRGLDMCPGPSTLIAGYGYSAKTLASQAAAVAIVSGRRVWDSFAARTGRVLHVDYEQGKRLTLERYQRLCAAELLTPAEIEDRLMVVALPSVYLDTPGAEDVFARECEGFDLVIVDSLRAAAPSIEENSSDVRRVLDMLSRVSERVGCTVVVIHHARKPSQDKTGGPRMAIRGSGAIFDACASVLVFDGEKDRPTKVSHEKARTSGITADDFTLTVEDVEVDGNPRGGVRVTAATGPVTGSRHDNAHDEKVFDMLKAHPGSSGRQMCASFSDVPKGVIYDALARLEMAGRIESRSGPRRSTCWYAL